MILRNSALFLFSVIFICAPASLCIAGEEVEDMRTVSVQNLMIYEGTDTVQTLPFILEEVYRNNPEIRAARAELYANMESLAQANAGWLPSLSAAASATYLDVDSDPESSLDASNTEGELSITLQQPVYRGGQTVAAIKAAENMIRASIEGVKATEQAVLYEAANSYMGLLQSKALYDLEYNNKELLREQFKAAQERFDVGDATRTDVSQARARLANAEAGVITAQGQLRSAASTYEKVTGTLPGTLSFPEIKLHLPKTLSDAQEIAEENNPALLAAKYNDAYAEYNVDNAFGALLPQVSLTGALSQTYEPYPGTLDEEDVASLSLTASIPLYQAGSTRSKLRQAKYIKRQRQIEITEVLNTTRNNVVESWEALDSARAEIKAREKQVEASKIAREGVKQESQLGTRTILDSLDADQEYLEAQVAFVTAKTREKLATFSLALNIGLLTPETIGFIGLDSGYLHDLDKTSKDFLRINVDIDED